MFCTECGNVLLGRFSFDKSYCNGLIISDGFRLFYKDIAELIASEMSSTDFKECSFSKIGWVDYVISWT